MHEFYHLLFGVSCCCVETQRPGEKVSGLAHAAGETGQSAQMVREHAGELAQHAESLRGEVDRFLSRIRAA